MSDDTQVTDNDQATENAKVGYQVAIELWTYEGELVWSKFNAMLVANSIVLALIGFTLNSNQLPQVLAVGMPVAGLLLCLAWFLLTKRGFDNYVYWILSARELEERHLAPIVRTVSRGAYLADGGKVEIAVGGKSRKYQMGWFSRLLRAEWSAYLVIIVFAVMYVLLWIYK